MSNIHFHFGEKIEGRWNKNIYKILRLLGKGGIGSVYQVKSEDTGKIYALKISQDLQSITKEYQMLEKFQYIDCIPRVFEIDDFAAGNNIFHYIIMEYIQGRTLKEHIKNKKISPLTGAGLIIIIGKYFRELHINKLVFGDLKSDNIMIDDRNTILKIIDLGGVTQIGASIKEFTPLYDRTSWDRGLRTADSKYDLFALNILFIVLLLGEEFQPKQINISNLIARLKGKGIPKDWIYLIRMGLEQEIEFDYFIQRLEKSYIKRPRLFKITRVNLLNMLIDLIFIGSILFCTGVLYLLLGKRLYL